MMKILKEYDYKTRVPAVGECQDCGAEVTLFGSDNECTCGAIYNLFGQRLAPREQWGEEFNFQDDY